MPPETNENRPSHEDHAILPPAPEIPAEDHPSGLVADMIEAGAWPAPALLRRLLESGDRAVGPLLDLLRNPPDGDHDCPSVWYAMGLLGMLHPPEALAAFLELARTCWDDLCNEAAVAAAAYGKDAFQPLLDAVRDPAARGYRRVALIQGAFLAAGTDSNLLAQVGDAVRAIFRQVADEARADRQFDDELLSDAEKAGRADHATDLHDQPIEEIDDDDILQPSDPAEATSAAGLEPDDEAANELLPAEELGYLVGSLHNHLGAAARPLLKAAFDEGLVDLDLAEPELLDEEPHPPVLPDPNRWLGDYSTEYQLREKVEALKKSAPVKKPVWTAPPLEGTTPEPQPRLDPVAPIRNTGPRVGRNDPCWCGSGKKYKKCHLGRDGGD
ncbi:YecA family protein [Aquisphaera insulae]|uniref:YecA family protein n=1 Tax=Aquisphaera insulae TaxID=2712864 RepID=UPI0013EDF091|nr:SEC-C metal-binding domain-containing protein [Aquisphaera insulae]